MTRYCTCGCDFIVLCRADRNTDVLKSIYCAIFHCLINFTVSHGGRVESESLIGCKMYGRFHGAKFNARCIIKGLKIAVEVKIAAGVNKVGDANDASFFLKFFKHLRANARIHDLLIKLHVIVTEIRHIKAVQNIREAGDNRRGHECCINRTELNRLKNLTLIAKLAAWEKLKCNLAARKLANLFIGPQAGLRKSMLFIISRGPAQTKNFFRDNFF